MVSETDGSLGVLGGVGNLISVIAGRYANPHNPNGAEWWSGSAWTDHARSATDNA